MPQMLTLAATKAERSLTVLINHDEAEDAVIIQLIVMQAEN
jgi:hypothetical protein